MSEDLTPNRLRVAMAAAVSACTALAFAPPPASAAGLLGLYAGGSVGQSSVTSNFGGLASPFPDHFDKNDFAFKLMAGLRPIPLLGAEIEYIDFGHPHGSLAGLPADVSLHGVAAFGVLYLPVPVVDVFLKAGVANLQDSSNGFFYQLCPGSGTGLPGANCSPRGLLHQNNSTTDFAVGAGVQYKFGSLALRGEYERFASDGGNPELLSVGVTWSF